MIIQTHQPRRLQCQFVHRVDTGPWVEASMRAAAGDDEFGGSRRLAPRFELPLGSVCGLENEHRRAAARFVFDYRA